MFANKDQEFEFYKMLHHASLEELHTMLHGIVKDSEQWAESIVKQEIERRKK